MKSAKTRNTGYFQGELFSVYCVIYWNVKAGKTQVKAEKNAGKSGKVAMTALHTCENQIFKKMEKRNFFASFGDMDITSWLEFFAEQIILR